MPSIDPAFMEEASAVVRKLLQAHEREVASREFATSVSRSPRHLEAGEPLLERHELAQQALRAASHVTDAAIAELVLTLDDRIQDRVLRLVQRTGLTLQEPAR